MKFSRAHRIRDSHPSPSKFPILPTISISTGPPIPPKQGSTIQQTVISKLISPSWTREFNYSPFAGSDPAEFLNLNSGICIWVFGGKSCRFIAILRTRSGIVCVWLLKVRCFSVRLCVIAAESRVLKGDPEKSNVDFLYGSRCRSFYIYKGFSI